MGYIRPLGGYPTGPQSLGSEDDPAIWFRHLNEPLPVAFSLLWLAVGLVILLQGVAFSRAASRVGAATAPRRQPLDRQERTVVAVLLLVLYAIVLGAVNYYFKTRDRYVPALAFFDGMFVCLLLPLVALPLVRVGRVWGSQKIGVAEPAAATAAACHDVGEAGDADGEGQQQISGGEGMQVLGLRQSAEGTAMRFMLRCGSLSWLGTVGVILLGYYHNCQFTGIDNSCFYGDYTVFGSYARNSNILFQSWWIMLLWFSPQIFLRRRIHTWCLRPCPLAEAEFVHVWVSNREEATCHVVAPSTAVRATRWMRALMSAFSFGIGGHEGTVAVTQTSADAPRFFVFECVRYVLDDNCGGDRGGGSGYRRAALSVGREYATLHDSVGGLAQSEAEARLAFMGQNVIPFTVDSWGEATSKEFFQVFYLYQFLIYVVWFWFSYIFVAFFLGALVVFSGFVNIHLARTAQKTIAALTSTEGNVLVIRSGERVRVSSRELVPGDVAIVGSECTLPCDFVILRGALVCDESGLTGESMPVRKIALPKPFPPSDPSSSGGGGGGGGGGGISSSSTADLYDPAHRDTKHTLFAGCRVLQAGDGGDDEVLALCTATGIDTNRGQLVAHILFPEPMRFAYDEEFPIVLGILGVCCLVIFNLATYLQALSGQPKSGISAFCYGLFTISQTVSPLLPLSLVVGQTASYKRLKKMGVNCIDPKRIAIAGKVRCFCFDKTGTLTKDGLEFIGVQHMLPELQEASFAPFVNSTTAKIASVLAEHRANPRVIEGLASCHAVTRYGEDQLVGNQVEVRMFTATEWVLEEGGGGTGGEQPRVYDPKTGRTLSIEKRFEFDHEKMMMSVITVDAETGEAFVFAKGAPEAIARVCARGANSDLPVDFQVVASAHAMQGCYVLALACRRLKPGTVSDLMSRADAERELSFLSLILFRNEIKPDTFGALTELKAGDCRTVMITGDNAQCGLYIAKQGGMISEQSQVILGEVKPGAPAAPHVSRGENISVVWRHLESAGSSGSGAATLELSTPELLGMLGGADEADIELAVTGAAWNQLCAEQEHSHDDSIERLLHRTRIFARVSPQGKEAIVRQHISSGLITGMCGDGGNDCGALRVAHVGVAFSEAEASVVSPFTSKSKRVTDTVALLREGRCALATSFAGYKFIIMYGQIFPLVKLWCFYFGVIMPMLDYLFIDVIMVMALSAAITRAPPLDSLGTHRPTSSLLGPTTVASVLGPTILNMLCLLLAMRMIQEHPQYVRFPAAYSEGAAWWTLGDNWESTTLFVCFSNQFVTSALSFSLGGRFRKGLVENSTLLATCAAFYLLFAYIILAPPNAFIATFHIASIDYNSNGTESPVWQNYHAVCCGECKARSHKSLVECQEDCWTVGMPFMLRLRLWALTICFCLWSFFWEKVVVQGPVRDWVRSRYPKAGLVTLRL